MSSTPVRNSVITMPKLVKAQNWFNTRYNSGEAVRKSPGQKIDANTYGDLANK